MFNLLVCMPTIFVFCRDDCAELRSRIGHSMLFHSVSSKSGCGIAEHRP